MLQKKTSVSLGREGRRYERRTTLSHSLLTVALMLATIFLPQLNAQCPDPPTSCQMNCNQNMQVSLNQNCLAEITVALLIEDPTTCPDGIFQVYVTVNGDTIDTSPFVTEAEIGQPVIAHLYDSCSGNSCWAPILVEDKLPPEISCNCDSEVPSDTNCIMNCLESIVYPGPDVTENCSFDTVILLSRIWEPYCNVEFPLITHVMISEYTAVDAYHNYADTCVEYIFLEQMDFDMITWPPHFVRSNMTEFECDEDFLDEDPEDGTPDAAEIALDGAGIPKVNGIPIYPFWIEACNALVSYQDVVQAETGCLKKVRRIWTVQEWLCNDERDTVYTQNIEIVDNDGPELWCPDDVTVSTGLTQCQAPFHIPLPPHYEDNCSDVVRISVIYPYGTALDILGTGGIYVNLPVADNIITYIAYDECGKSSTCDWIVTVEDHTRPVPVCDEHTIVSLTNDYDLGLTLVSASVFDDGSYDECGPVTFMARRMNSCINFDWTTNGPGYDEVPDGWIDVHDASTAFHPYVAFACCDVDAGPIVIELRVTDASMNHNTCMVIVNVQDKIAPIIHCPNDVTVSCDFEFDPYGDLSILFGDVVLDPDDREEHCFVDPGQYGNLICVFDGYAKDNCEVEVDVDVYVNIDNCGVGHIRRDFTATDGGGRTDVCSQYIWIQNHHPFYISDQTCFNADPNDGVIWPCNRDVIGCGENTHPDVTGRPVIFEDQCDLIGVNYTDQVFDIVQGACLKILRTWRVIDWCQYGQNGSGGWNGYWQYTQIIKVTDTEHPFFTPDPEDEVIANDIDCESVDVDLIQEGEDDCTPDEELRWSYAIDLHNDLVIDDSDSGFGALIDASRPFPVGVHRVIYAFEDGCGGQTVREQLVTVTAMKPPVPVCYGLLHAELTDPDDDVVIWAVDCDASSYHPCLNTFTLSFDPIDTNMTSVSFGCEFAGMIVEVQMWVTDVVTGAQDYCTVMIEIQDNGGICSGQNLTGTISGKISTEFSQDVKEVGVNLSGSTLNPVMTSGTGQYTFPSMPFGGSYEVMPEKNTDWKNGVTTLDLILIQKHLLGMQALSSPYKMIAADANRSSSISALDIVELRRLILGVVTEIPENTSWRFVDKAYDFTDPANPFNEQFAESFQIAPFSTTIPDVDFIAIKVGDINNTVVANLNQIVTRTYPGTVALQVDDRQFKAGETVEFSVSVADRTDLEGYQFTLDFDPAKLSFETYSSGMMFLNDDNFNLLRTQEGLITTSWSDVKPYSIAGGEAMFTLRFNALASGTLSEVLSISSDPTVAEAYNGDGDVLNLSMQFGNQTVSQTAAEFELLENRPNPFSESTTVVFVTPRASEATLTIYDVTGQVVLEKQIQAVVGLNEVEVKGLTARGVLYCQVSTDEFSATRKMIRME